MKYSFRRFIPLIPVLLCILGIVTVFDACPMKEDGTWMRCHNARDLSLLVALGISALLLAASLIPSRPARLVLYVLSIAGCVLLFLVPGPLSAMCMIKTMRCYTVMQPFVRIMSVLTALTTLFPFLSTCRKSRKNRTGRGR